ncbi:GPI ethanolamine phosphate transferase 1 isoform X2 [Armigeres subalbatus]|uniref:GPI ethanolamine phosphate transferase 1 isoform X2 n=1 Tax=Armigeres subalbatus TaxID=124917 RepID=UPI002ED1B6EE
MLRFAFIALFIHVLFLLSIFYIYFQSPILRNLPIGADYDDAPADRVVIFIADGLRAESFLEHQANRTKFLRRMIISNGAFGISHTRVPTESRPGHVALFAGLYEDPSAIFKGWKENPVEFDSVFNRSHATYSWGSPDILSVFSSKMETGTILTESYPADVEEFSQTTNTSILDLWVFDKVKQYFQKPENIELLMSKKNVILFLHLLGMDTSGHVHKPYSQLYTENLIIVDQGIEQIVHLIDQVTNHDLRTTYIFTSDHGMTDKGSHGSGHPRETETPFVAWGAGIHYWKDVWIDEPGKHVIIDEVLVPRWDINQADVTPLISALLGQAVPKNSCGKLPRQYLNATEAYVAKCMRANADQLYQQYSQYRHESSQKLFKWNISQKESDYVVIISKLRYDVEIVYRDKNFKKVIALCDALIDVTLEVIEFYQTYYKNELLFMLTLAMTGWILIVLGKLFVFEEVFPKISRKLSVAGITAMIVITGYNYFQGTPRIVTFYFLLPLFIWIPVVASSRAYIKMISLRVLGQTVVFVGFAELCVMAFFQRSVLSLFLFGNTIYLAHKLKQLSGSKLVYSLVFSNAVLAVFPILPVVEKDSNHPWLSVLGVCLWTVVNTLITINSKENIMYRCLQSIVCWGLAINLLISIYIIEKGMTLCWWNQTLSWIFFVNLAGPYMILSLSYEPLFYLAFCISLFYWLRAENEISTSRKQISDLFFTYQPTQYKNVDFDDFRRSLTFVFYMLISFFGTGNMATVSSFDPNWVRLLVTTFSPFLMTCLIVFKLLIPILVSVCILRSLQISLNVRAQTLFLLIFVICDLMCLHFFYLIKNKGSWLEIGSSISHFVIMECTTIVLILLYGGATFMTEFSLVEKISNHQGLTFGRKTNKD